MKRGLKEGVLMKETEHQIVPIRLTLQSEDKMHMTPATAITPKTSGNGAV